MRDQVPPGIKRFPGAFLFARGNIFENEDWSLADKTAETQDSLALHPGNWYNKISRNVRVKRYAAQAGESERKGKR